MKMWGSQNFANRSPVRYDGRNLHAVPYAPMAKVEAQYAWVSSLPIAAAVFSHENDAIAQIASNQQFDNIIVGENREAGLDMAEFALRIDAIVRENRQSHFECWQSSDPVNRRELEINIARFGEQQDKFLFSLVDRTAEATSRSNLRREMLSDSLTGFFNRSGFEEEVENALSKLASANAPNAVHSNYAIILIDLARFSLVNESVGALAGDELIITVARRLYSRVRRNEILGRLGGNEFALFVDLDNAGECVKTITQRLSDALAEPCQLSGLEIQVECAFAAAVGKVSSDDPSDIIRFAQIALKRAKSSKRFELYSAGGVDTSRQRFSIETDLRRALQNDELELHYQPLMDMKTGQINGFEALARWQHPDLGFISPIDFIPVAEESGLIVPLGRWALEQAARTISDWDSRAAGELPFKISVNMSAVQLLRDDVVDAVSGALKGAGICGSRMTIELTESAFVSDPDGAKRILDALKSLNTNLAMDDFGTGYSNLAYLQQLPIDVLKIDRSFINGMLENRDKRAIVRTVLSLARALGMQTTAEGIETEATSDALKKLGCSVGQGYYYARPLTAEAAYAFLADSRASFTS
jgi:c-di-GMP phosphodiesterase Gmr